MTAVKSGLADTRRLFSRHEESVTQLIKNAERSYDIQGGGIKGWMEGGWMNRLCRVGSSTGFLF